MKSSIVLRKVSSATCGAGLRTVVSVWAVCLVSSCANNMATTDAGVLSGVIGGSNDTAGRLATGTGGAKATGGAGATGNAGSRVTSGSGGTGSGGTSTTGATSATGGTNATSGTGGTPAMDASTPNLDAGHTSMGMDAAMMPRDAGVHDSGTSGNTNEEDGGVCMPPDEPLTLTGATKCPTDVCPAGDSICVPTTLLTALKISMQSIDLLADCAEGQKCVPQEFVAEAGRSIQPTCRSLNNAEGRCLSSCIPEVAQEASLLPRDVCTGTDLCAPCYDPRTGADTHACEQGCDPGPKEPPRPFAHCCSDRGLCVPPNLAGAQAANLVRDTCSSDTLCAPTELTDPTYKPATCSSITGVEGRCISTCVGGAVAQQKDRLPTAGCAQNEVCAPCFDPITGNDTGACRVNGDAPAQPAQLLPRCCDNGQGTKVGVCVTSQLAGNEASMLRQDTCAQGQLCAPITKAEDPNYRFPVCYGLGTGACVPSCILDPLEAGILSRVTCDVGELCAPCTLLNVPTGACN